MLGSKFSLTMIPCRYVRKTGIFLVVRLPKIRLFPNDSSQNLLAQKDWDRVSITLIKVQRLRYIQVTLYVVQHVQVEGGFFSAECTIGIVWGLRR